MNINSFCIESNHPPKRNYSRFDTLRNLGMWTSESGKFLLAKSRILRFGIRNPSSTGEESRAWNSQSGIKNPGLLWISSHVRESEELRHCPLNFCGDNTFILLLKFVWPCTTVKNFFFSQSLLQS